MSKKKKKKQLKVEKTLVDQFVANIKENYDRTFTPEDVIESRLDAQRKSVTQAIDLEEEDIVRLSTAISSAAMSGLGAEWINRAIIDLLVKFVIKRHSIYQMHKNTMDMEEACFERALLKIAKKKLH